MHQIQLTDEVYERAVLRANESGFDSVDEYIVDMLAEDELIETPDMSHLFTPERLAIIDKAAAQLDAGECYTMEQVRENLAQHRAEWLRKNSK